MRFNLGFRSVCRELASLPFATGLQGVNGKRQPLMHRGLKEPSRMTRLFGLAACFSVLKRDCP